VTLEIRVSPEAERDLLEAYVWYERSRPGLGSVFLDAVTTALAQVAQFPKSGFPMEGDTRQVLTERFPYGLLYEDDEREIFVLACFHLHRDEEVWRSRRPRDA
jgi:toxin ParE1/3/4